VLGANSSSSSGLARAPHHGDALCLGGFQESCRWLLVLGDDQTGDLGSEQVRHDFAATVIREALEVGELSLAQDLHPIRDEPLGEAGQR
jgi:hypothetical protein